MTTLLQRLSIQHITIYSLFAWSERSENKKRGFQSKLFQADGESFSEWKLKKKHRLEGNKKTLRLLVDTPRQARLRLRLRRDRLQAM